MKKAILILLSMLLWLTACVVNETPAVKTPVSAEPTDKEPEAGKEPEVSEALVVNEEPAIVEEEPRAELTAEAFRAVTGWVRYEAEPGEKNREQRMAHNIYSDPSLSGSSGFFTIFTIDFLADDDASGTYWALCNWEMDKYAFAQNNQYSDVSGGGAYAGLQNTQNGKMAIMSFWEISYKDPLGKEHILNAQRVYPSGKSNTFGNEGSGTNCIAPYQWESGSWYRMVLRCWEDSATGHTFVGQWVCALDTGAWTLISYFDTGLINSCFTGTMSQFMENYDYATYGKVRSFRYKNMYVRNRYSDIWLSLDSSYLSIDTWYGNKKGRYLFGAEPTFFWGAVCGLGEDQAESDVRGNVGSHLKIEQPAEPEIAVPNISSLSALYKKNGSIAVKWQLDPLSAPQLGYEIKILNSANETVHSQAASIPEADFCEIEQIAPGTYKVSLTITDLYGQTTAMEADVLAG